MTNRLLYQMSGHYHAQHALLIIRVFNPPTPSRASFCFSTTLSTAVAASNCRFKAGFMAANTDDGATEVVAPGPGRSS